MPTRHARTHVHPASFGVYECLDAIHYCLLLLLANQAVNITDL